VHYHPAIGEFRRQLPRIGLIALLLTAAVTLIGLDTRRAELPSERWYRLSRQQVMEADMSWRLGEALETLAGRLPFASRDQAWRLRERAVAAWERRTLVARPNHAAAYRLGVIYGHRGYYEHSSDMFALAASLDEGSSEYYYALAEAYASADPDEDVLREKLGVIAERRGWLTDLVLEDVYTRMGREEHARRVAERREARSIRFAAGLGGVALLSGALLLIGVVAILVLLLRRGLTVPEPVARLPFIVPWTIIDAAESVAVLLCAMLVGGLLTSLTIDHLPRPEQWPLGRPLVLGIQYLLVSGITIAVVIYRVKQRGARPLKLLGMRFRGALRLVGTGVVGYAVFLTVMMVVALVTGLLVGEGLPLAQTTEDMISAAEGPAEIFAYFVLFCIAAPIVEELMFRGYVYGGLRRVLPSRYAIPAGAAVFAAVHLNAEAFLVIGLIGVTLCYLYERSRSLLPGMIAHGVHNGLVMAVMLLQSM